MSEALKPVKQQAFFVAHGHDKIFTGGEGGESDPYRKYLSLEKNGALCAIKAPEATEGRYLGASNYALHSKG